MGKNIGVSFVPSIFKQGGKLTVHLQILTIKRLQLSLMSMLQKS